VPVSILVSVLVLNESLLLKSVSVFNDDYHLSVGSAYSVAMLGCDSSN
jgi:hypothetical protein